MLSVAINDLRFRNPLLLASGILDESGESMLQVIKHGAGGVVTKSIGMEPREGYENPVIYELSYGLLNAIGLANPGIENYGEEIKIAKRGGVPVIGSVFGKDAEEFAYLARKMEEYGVDAVELNLSCPHARGYGMEIGVDAALVEEIVKEVKRKVNIPVWAKLTPNTHNIVEIAKAASDSDALVLINTVRAMAIDIEAKLPVLSNIFGGLSGPCIKPIGIRAVYEVYREVEKPIVGVGGIIDARDVIEYIMAGASAVEIGTAIYLRGIHVFSEIASEMEDWMKKHGYEKIEELVGIAQVR
ncbi:MAG: dihydroorotate dehydrogenase [Thermoplasmata archaeon]|nr:dihydroorotate dehydrogenase [Thermoplasmata archaeon]